MGEKRERGYEEIYGHTPEIYPFLIFLAHGNNEVKKIKRPLWRRVKVFDTCGRGEKTQD